MKMRKLNSPQKVFRGTRMVLLALLAWGVWFSALAQSGAEGSLRQLDSLLAGRQQQAQQLITAFDSLRRADSLLQYALEQQLADQNFGTLRQRRQLRARLDSLEQAREARDARFLAQQDSIRRGLRGVPVLIYQDTAFFIHASLGPLRPSDRAAGITETVEELANSRAFGRDTLTIIEEPQRHYVMLGRTLVMTITPLDAFWLGQDRAQVASEQVAAINEAVAEHRRQTHFLYTILRFAVLILLLAIFYFGIRYMNRGFTTLNRKLLARRRLHFSRDLKYKHYKILTVEQAEKVLQKVLTGVKWITIGAVVYFTLPAALSIFPQTKAIADTLLGFVVTPLTMFFSAIIGYIPEMFTIIVIMVITYYIVALLRFIAREVESGMLHLPGFYPEWAAPTFNILRILVYTFAFIVIFPYLPGSDSPVFQGVSVFLGLLISLGSSSAISNIIAGLVIIYMRAFKVGDRVKIGETTGDVVEKTMLVTRVRTIKNENITIPNSAILNGSTVNYTASAKDLGLILNTTVTIGYDVPWRQVHELLINAALKTGHIMEKPQPFVLQTSLDDFYVSYQINAYTENAGIAAKIYSELHSHIQDAFNDAGVEILSPHYRAARDGNMVTIPPNYLPPDYRPPAFSVKFEDSKQQVPAKPSENGPE